MAIPAMPDDQIAAEAPLDEDAAALYVEREQALYDQADNEGSGIDSNVVAFFQALIRHRHNGDPGQGQPIDTPGIAKGAVNDSDMMHAGSVGQGEVADTTMLAENIAPLAATVDKFHGTLRTDRSGTWGYDVDGDPPVFGPDMDYPGQCRVISNPTGVPCVVAEGDCAEGERGEWHRRGFCNSDGLVGAGFSHFKLGLNEAIVVLRYGTAGTAHYSVAFLG